MAIVWDPSDSSWTGYDNRQWDDQKLRRWHYRTPSGITTNTSQIQNEDYELLYDPRIYNEYMGYSDPTNTEGRPDEEALQSQEEISENPWSWLGRRRRTRQEEGTGEQEEPAGETVPGGEGTGERDRPAEDPAEEPAGETAPTIEQREYAALTPEEFFNTAGKKQLGAVLRAYGYDMSRGMAGAVSEMKSDLAGIPIVSGYYDGDGNFVVEGTNVNQVRQLKELGDIEVPSWSEFIQNDNEYARAREGLATLLDEWESGGITTDEGDFVSDEERAGRYAAENLGFDSFAEFQERMKSLQESMDPTLSGELSETQERAVAREAQMLREEAQQTIESLGLESSARALQQSVEISSQISNNRLQAELAFEEANLAKEQMEYENILAEFETLGTASAREREQYQEMLYRNRMGALQGYAQTITAASQEYQNELAGLEAHASTTYQSIMASMGYESHLMEQSQAAYNSYVQPILDQLAVEQTENAIEIAEIERAAAQKEEEAEGVWNLVGGGLSIIGGIASMFTGNISAGASLATTGLGILTS